MNEEYIDRARLLIESVYGAPPSESNDCYVFYSKALEVEAEQLSKQDSSAGLKKLTLGDSTEEYFDNAAASASSDIICDEAKTYLDRVYGSVHFVSIL